MAFHFHIRLHCSGYGRCSWSIHLGNGLVIAFDGVEGYSLGNWCRGTLQRIFIRCGMRFGRSSES